MKSIIKKVEEFLSVQLTGKTVYFKDGTHIYVEDGITWEYENDANWLKTI